MTVRLPGTRAAAALTALALAYVPIPATAATADAGDSSVPATAPPVSTTPATALPTLMVTTSSAGFTHPGIGVTAHSLEFARSQVRAGVQPWKGYFDALGASKYASRTLVSKNRSSVLDQPAIPYFTSTVTESKLIEDSWGAFAQAVEYFMTGDDVYRANSMKIIRIWSNMDPARYAYYADSQIHTGVPLYRLLAAAEILRYSSYDPAYTAYDLAWRDSDTAKLTSDLIAPMTATFLYKNTNYYNQHSYPLVGALAGYIFTDNRPRYNEGVEWYTVNSTTARPEQNGALGPIYPLISKDNPLNPYGYSFVQHQEMGRDQAHAGDDVDTLTGLARIISVQGTTVDPVHGTVSTAPDAVDAYHFLGDRLLAGANAYARYMLGYDTPWIDTTGGPGAISSGYRGRLYQIAELDELYDQYQYVEGVDVDQEAPYLAKAHRQNDGPLYYAGSTTLNNWWGGIDTGPEYWLSFPAQLAGQSPVPAGGTSTEVEQKGIAFDPGTEMRTQDGRTFAEMHASPQGTTLVVHDLVYGNRNNYCPVGLLIRTSGPGMRLAVSKDQHTAPFRTLDLPDTDGEWRYVTYDVAYTAVHASQVGDNIAYYTVTGPDGGTVDIDHVNTLAPTQLTPPQFPQGQTADIVGVTRETLTTSFAATDADPAETLTYRGYRLPAGAHLDPVTGQFTWTPEQRQYGAYQFLVVVDDGITDSVLEVTVHAEPNRQQAYRQALTGYDPKQTYSTASLAAFQQVAEQVRASITSADDAGFLSSLVTLQQAVRSLQLLNPLLGDGTLDYPPLVTSSLPALNLANLVDDDFNTYTGDLKAPFTVDFGAGYRVSASAFGLQARYNFANRSQGANVYGSEDGQTWTLLTSRETTDTTSQNFAMETIPVRPEVQDLQFRYFKVQVDDPGIPTDPAYPGLSSFSEFRIHGVRHEVQL